MPSGAFNDNQKALFLPLWERKIRSSLNNADDFRREIERGTDKLKFRAGKYVISLKTGRNMAIGGRAELGDMPTAQVTPLAQASIDVRYLYASVKVSYPSQERTLSSEGALMELAKLETESIVENLLVRKARMLLSPAIQDGTGTNYCGVACIVNGTQAAATTINVFGYLGWTKGNGGTNWVTRGNDALEVGDLVVFGTPTTLANGAGSVRTVTAKNEAGTTITVSPAVSVTDGDLVVRGETAYASGNEYNAIPSGLGFLQMQDETGVDKFQGQGITSAGFEHIYKANRKSNNSAGAGTLAPWNSDRTRQLIKQHVYDVGATKLTKLRLFSQWGVHQAYEQTLVDRVRYSDRQNSEPTAAQFLQVADKQVPWFVDRHPPRDKLLCLDLSSLIIPEMHPGAWHKWRPGGDIFRDLSGTDAFIGRWKEYSGFGCRNLGANLLIDDIEGHDAT